MKLKDEHIVELAKAYISNTEMSALSDTIEYHAKKITLFMNKMREIND